MSENLHATGGVLGFLKPPGMTSHDAVALVRKRIGTAKVGHGGTLDPIAAGVLPILVGEATRLTPILDTLHKEYRAIVLFGVATTTGDLAGRPTSRQQGLDLSEDRVAAAVKQLKGTIMQQPPAYSARRVGGRRLYDLARTGQVTEDDLVAASRKIQVLRADMIACGVLGWGIYGHLISATIDISCTKGTYIRELATRLGTTLGCSACLALLVRTWSGGLGLADCLLTDDLLLPAAGTWEQRFGRSWRTNSEALAFLPAAVTDAVGTQMMGAGRPLTPDRILGWLAPHQQPLAHQRTATIGPDAQWVRVLDQAGRLLALAIPDQVSADPGQCLLRPRRVFLQASRGGARRQPSDS